jgi:Ca-activated chloride channel family protein
MTRLELMLHPLTIHRRSSNRRGAMLPLIAVCLVILFCSVVIGIDIARMHTTRSELRTATDAAARAGAEALGRLQSREAAVAAAIQLASLNEVAGRPLTLSASQIQVGRTIITAGATTEFQPDVLPFNAVRVVGERTSNSSDGSIGLFFGGMFGVTQFEPIQAATACRLDRDIALVLDISGSMASGGRMAGLKNAVDIFLEELVATPHIERVSLIVYSTTAQRPLELTENLAQIRQTLLPIPANGMTAIGLGLQSGLDSVRNDPLARPFAEKTVIVMTDGHHNTGISPLTVANTAGATTIHTVTFGSGANQSMMQDLARRGNGIHLHANSNQQLAEAFRDIARQLSVMLVE